MTSLTVVKAYEFKKLKQYLCGRSTVVIFSAQNIEITKFFYKNTALFKNKIITIFVKLVHKLFIG